MTCPPSWIHLIISVYVVSLGYVIILNFVPCPLPSYFHFTAQYSTYSSCSSLLPSHKLWQPPIFLCFYSFANYTFFPFTLLGNFCTQRASSFLSLPYNQISSSILCNISFPKDLLEGGRGDLTPTAPETVLPQYPLFPSFF